MNSYTEETLDKYPFLSLVQYGGQEYIGIIQNHDDTVLSMYNFSKLKTKEDKERFLTLGEQWWWESNRMIPINLFLKHDFKDFYHALDNFNIKDCTVLHGPKVSIQELSKRRTKRRNIQLIKKVK
jgi:hypothetical protein